MRVANPLVRVVLAGGAIGLAAAVFAALVRRGVPFYLSVWSVWVVLAAALAYQLLRRHRRPWLLASTFTVAFAGVFSAVTAIFQHH